MPDHEAYERNEVERQRAAGDFTAVWITRVQTSSHFIPARSAVVIAVQYDMPNTKPPRWGHTCAEDTVDLAIRAGVKQLFLFHHDPDHDDAKIAEMVAQGEAKVREKESALKVAAAREGAEFVL